MHRWLDLSRHSSTGTFIPLGPRWSRKGRPVLRCESGLSCFHEWVSRWRCARNSLTILPAKLLCPVRAGRLCIARERCKSLICKRANSIDFAIRIYLLKRHLNVCLISILLQKTEAKVENRLSPILYGASTWKMLNANPLVYKGIVNKGTRNMHENCGKRCLSCQASSACHTETTLFLLWQRKAITVTATREFFLCYRCTAVVCL